VSFLGDNDSIFGPFATRERFVVAQLGQSLDGRIATPTGASHWINGPLALDHLHRIRANVDAVLVGVGTVIADDPLLTVRRVPGKNPVRVILDPMGRLPATARCLHADSQKTLVLQTGPTGVLDGAEKLVLPGEARVMAPSTILDALFRRGLRRILIEGGSRTISLFLDAGAIDRLHVCVAALIIGSGKPGLDLKPIAHLTEALRPKTRIHPLGDSDVLFDCDLRASAKH
jgi:riboflavin-specific deaminase-like protein